jgi:hypothetical protein
MSLTDHAKSQERLGRERARRALLPREYGEFIAGLAPWSWFVTITFKGNAPVPDAGLAAIREWLVDLQAGAGGRPIGWALAEEFGRLGGRWHCHLLICGVSHLNRRFWWREAFRRFGRTTIEPFNPQKGAAFYAAKYAAKALGRIHFGGVLAGCEFDRLIHSPDGRRDWEESFLNSSPPSVTHGIVAPSANVGREFFRLGLGRWHR